MARVTEQDFGVGGNSRFVCGSGSIAVGGSVVFSEERNGLKESGKKKIKNSFFLLFFFSPRDFRKERGKRGDTGKGEGKVEFLLFSKFSES